MNTSTSSETVSSSSLASAAIPVGEGTRWSLDGGHSHVGFSVRHMMIANVRGEFEKVAGEVFYDRQRPEESRVSVTVDVASIDTREARRDAHLRSADFFDAENHPQMTFVSNSSRSRGDGLDLVGDLTIRGTTREIVLSVDEITPEHSDPWGNRRIGASARAKIRRSDFGMRWNAALEAGGVLVGDEVSIQIDVELVLQK